MNTLTLKWGTIKSWKVDTDEALAAIQRWADGGVNLSAIMQENTSQQKQAILDVIDLMDEIWLDWDNKKVSKEEAKRYIRSHNT